jgi:hypothetical protein
MKTGNLNTLLKALISSQEGSGGELLCGNEHAVPQPTSSGWCQSSWSGLLAPSSPSLIRKKPPVTD